MEASGESRKVRDTSRSHHWDPDLPTTDGQCNILRKYNIRILGFSYDNCEI